MHEEEANVTFHALRCPCQHVASNENAPIFSCSFVCRLFRQSSLQCCDMLYMQLIYEYKLADCFFLLLFFFWISSAFLCFFFVRFNCPFLETLASPLILYLSPSLCVVDLIMFYNTASINNSDMKLRILLIFVVFQKKENVYRNPLLF